MPVMHEIVQAPITKGLEIFVCDYLIIVHNTFLSVNI